MAVLDETEKKMKDAIEHLNEELKKIRTGHANTAMVENVTVDAYGTKMKLRDLATITTPEPRQLLITPFDAGNSGPIGKGIENANLGLMPIVDAGSVRINIPSMDESIRNEMVKLCHKKQEEAKVSIRNDRREANEIVRKQKSDGDIGEDIEKTLEKDIQNLTDKYCQLADTQAKEKEKAISTI